MIGMTARRDPADLDKNLPLSQGQDSSYARYGIACWRGNNETPKDFGNSLATLFFEYANKSEDFLGTQNKFIHRHDNKPIKLKPMNYYLCNRVTLPLLKKIY